MSGPERMINATAQTRRVVLKPFVESRKFITKGMISPAVPVPAHIMPYASPFL